jgi:hypothetical protein
MTFLAPWALAIGAVTAAALVVLHLVARQRPAAYPLPTARFVPDRRTLVSRVSSTPRDLLLLLLRVLLVLSATMAFARPTLTPQRTVRARVVVLDRSSMVADAGAALRGAREIVRDGAPTRLVIMDSTATTIADASVGLDSLARVTHPRCCSVGSLSAALVAARRAAALLAVRADSVELHVLSPLTTREWDAATDSVRRLWPGRISFLRLTATADSVADVALERAMPAPDVLGPALAGRAVRPTATSVRILRREPGPADSAFARAGGVVVRWDSIGTRVAAPAAVVMGDDVVVASLGQDSITPAGTVLARWADGSPAAGEQVIGGGCVRVIGIGVPAVGDLPLRPAFGRMVHGLTGACAGTRLPAGAALDSARMTRLAGAGPIASGAALERGAEQRTPIVPWLLAFALACALAELALRSRRGAPEAA